MAEIGVRHGIKRHGFRDVRKRDAVEKSAASLDVEVGFLAAILAAVFPDEVLDAGQKRDGSAGQQNRCCDPLPSDHAQAQSNQEPPRTPLPGNA